MTRKPRPPSETELLAIWFVTDVLGQQWDYRTGGRHLADAKKLVNPPKEKAVSPYPVALVKACITALQEGKMGFTGKIETLYVVFFGTPPYIEQFKAWWETPPPAYLECEVERWEKVTGQTAYPERESDIMTTLPSAPSMEASVDSSNLLEQDGLPSHWGLFNG